MEQEVLQIVKQSTAQGDAQAVLDVMDNFVSSGKGMLINIGDAKTGLVDSVIAKHKPMVSTIAWQIGVKQCIHVQGHGTFCLRFVLGHLQHIIVELHIEGAQLLSRL